MTTILTANFEDQTIGNNPTNPPVYHGYADVEGKRWSYARGSETGTPAQGSKFLEYEIAASQTDAGSQIKSATIYESNPYLFTNGNTYYFCWYQRFNRVGGTDIWNTTSNYVQSGDKGVEVFSTTRGIRWIVSQGMWDGYQALGAGKWTVWLGNPSFHLNDGGDG